MKELKLKGAQSPLKQEVNTFCSCFPETLCNNVSYPRTGIRPRTYDHTAQCFTHGNAFLRLYVNDCNCNKSCLGTCFSRLVALITQKQYILPRDVVLNWFSLAKVVPKLSQDVCLGKGSGGTLKDLEVFFLSILSSHSRSI